MNVQSVGQPQIMTGASGGAVRGQRMSKMFNSIDTAGTGSITKAQFENAFSSLNLPGALKSESADAVWAKLDPNGTGTVTKQEFVSSMQKAVQAVHHGHHHRGSGGAAPTGAPDSTPPTDSASTGASGSVNLFA